MEVQQGAAFGVEVSRVSFQGCDAASQEKVVLFGPYQHGPLLMNEESSSVRRKVEVKGALHKGVQDIGWGRMSRTYCVSVRDRSEDFIEDQSCWWF